MSHPRAPFEQWLQIKAAQLHDVAGRPFQWLILHSSLSRWIQRTDPNSWSLLRLPLSLLIALALRAQHDEIAIAIFIIALLTDRLDGEIARSMKRTTSLGQHIDTFVDGTMIAAICLGLTERFGRLDIAGHSIAIAPLLVGLEAFRLSGGFLLRSWSQTLAEHSALTPNLSGKYKMAVFGLTILFLLMGFPVTARRFLLLTVLLSLYSLSRHVVVWTIARIHRPHHPAV